MKPEKTETSTRLDDVLQEWACFVVCPGSMAPTNVGEMQAVKTMMYNGLKLLQMAQALPRGGEDVLRLLDIARALVDYRKRAGALNFQLEKADYYMRELELALEGEPPISPLYEKE